VPSSGGGNANSVPSGECLDYASIERLCECELRDCVYQIERGRRILTNTRAIQVSRATLARTYEVLLRFEMAARGSSFLIGFGLWKTSRCLVRGLL
jgi:hypothetical protein